MMGKKSMGLGMLSGVSDNFSEALSALTTLGYQKANAEKALMKVSKELGGTATIEELIKNSLKIL
jgi:Holliday junction resolvasome RuvABC DNA-binding subunit